jgi:hypothetical protein
MLSLLYPHNIHLPLYIILYLGFPTPVTSVNTSPSKKKGDSVPSSNVKNNKSHQTDMYPLLLGRVPVVIGSLIQFLYTFPA